MSEFEERRPCGCLWRVVDNRQLIVLEFCEEHEEQQPEPVGILQSKHWKLKKLASDNSKITLEDVLLLIDGLTFHFFGSEADFTNRYEPIRHLWEEVHDSE